ncbi:hypothetical protein [Egbenema bharatensis]|uniref:hypothetical protein n=1 Tax=Egbenema bharatensis TaxID=3463334 RepID=UPI003A8ADFE1
MKRLKAILMVVMLCFSFAIASPAGADPIAEKSPEYAQITQTLNNLLQARLNPEAAGYSAEELQQEINTLQFQKYAMETTEDWGVCRNETGQTIGVYLHKPQKPYTMPYASSLYFLAPGQETDEDWDCDGVFVPSDAQIAGLDLGGAGAVKITDGTRLVVSNNPFAGGVSFNAPLAGTVIAEEGNWLIPNFTQSDVAAQFPNAPND